VLVEAPSHRASRHITDPYTVNLYADWTLIKLVTIAGGVKMTLNTIGMERVKVVTIAQFDHIA
jgi:hypothetical protein